MLFQELVPTLSDDEAHILKKYMLAKSAPKGFLLIQIDDEADDLFFIITGHFNVYKKINIATRDIAVQMASLNAPLIFGEMNFLLGSKRTAAVVAASDAKYFLLSKNNFEDMKKEHPLIALKVIEHLAIVSAERSLEFEKRIHRTIIKKSANSAHAMDKIDNYLGPAHICSPEIAKKLFGIEMTAEAVRTSEKTELQKSSATDEEYPDEVHHQQTA